MKTTVKMKLERTTPGAARYQEHNAKGQPLTTSDPECVIGTLYLRKLALGDKIPNEVTVDIHS